MSKNHFWYRKTRNVCHSKKVFLIQKGSYWKQSSTTIEINEGLVVIEEACFCYRKKPRFELNWIIFWWIVFVVWLTDESHLTLFPAGTIVRDPHHRESPTRREQDLNLSKTWCQALLNDGSSQLLTSNQTQFWLQQKTKSALWLKKLYD